MKNSKEVLKNNTYASYRVFFILKILYCKSCTIKELVECLQVLNRQEKQYTTAVVLKYIKTLKAAGIEIKKEKRKYKVVELPFKIKFSKEEIRALGVLEKINETQIQRGLKDTINEFLIQMKSRYSEESKQDLESIKNGIKFPEQNMYKVDIKKVAACEKYCEDELKLKISYKEINKEEVVINAQPIEIKIEKGLVYFSVKDMQKNIIKDILLTKLIKVEQLPQKISNQNAVMTTTTFKLRNELAKNYQLREHERVSYIDNEGIIIVNQREDKNMLIKRLIKYGKNAELIAPKAQRGMIKEEIDNMLKNYEK